ncbi:MAG: peptidoglycan recognition family protein [Pseudomonadota bacterium]
MSNALSGSSQFRLSADGDRAVALDGADIHYRGDSGCDYGRLATKSKEPFAAIILHHNPPYRSCAWLIDYQIKGDAARGGHFGYHFYVEGDGGVFQGAPLTVRTNHVKGLGYRVRTDVGRMAQNSNSIGITCVGAETAQGSAPTAAQQTITIALVTGLCTAFEIPFENVFGHGEVQSDRHPTEGALMAQMIRAGITPKALNAAP